MLFVALLQLPAPFSSVANQAYVEVHTQEETPAKKLTESPKPPKPVPVKPQRPVHEIAHPQPVPRQPVATRVPAETPVVPVSIHTINPLQPQTPTLTPHSSAPDSPRTPLEHPRSVTGVENIANLPNMPINTPRQHGSWAAQPGAGGNPGFGLTGPGKLSPSPTGGGAGINLPGVIGNAGALHPGSATMAAAGRGGSVNASGTFSPKGGGITLSNDDVGNLSGSTSSQHAHGSWAALPGAMGTPGFGNTGPGKLSPMQAGSGSGVNLPGVIANAGALRPGSSSTIAAGRGSGAGTPGTFSPVGHGITLSEGGVGNLPGSAPAQQQHGSWASHPGAGGIRTFGISGPGKLAPVLTKGGSGVNLPGAIGTTGTLRPGSPSMASAGRGVGRGTGGTFSPTGHGIALSEGGIGNLPGSAPGHMANHGSSWAAKPGSGGGGHGGSPTFTAIGPGHGTGKSSGGVAPSLVGAVGHGAGLTPGIGAGHGPGREGIGGGSGGGLDSNGTPGSGGDPLGNDVRRLPIASSGGVKGPGSAWADQPGSGNFGHGGNGLDLAPSGPSYSVKPIKIESPSYPSLAMKEHREGTVIIVLTIDSNAQVEKWTFIQRSSSDALDNAALKALKRLTFRAAMRNGIRVTDTVKFCVTFKTGKKPEVKQI